MLNVCILYPTLLKHTANNKEKGILGRMREGMAFKARVAVEL